MVFDELVRYRESDKGRDKRAGARAERRAADSHRRELGRRRAVVAAGEGEAAEEKARSPRWMDDPSRGEEEGLAGTDTGIPSKSKLSAHAHTHLQEEENNKFRPNPPNSLKK